MRSSSGSERIVVRGLAGGGLATGLATALKTGVANLRGIRWEIQKLPGGNETDQTIRGVGPATQKPRLCQNPCLIDQSRAAAKNVPYSGKASSSPYKIFDRNKGHIYSSTNSCTTIPSLSLATTGGSALLNILNVLSNTHNAAPFVGKLRSIQGTNPLQNPMSPSAA